MSEILALLAILMDMESHPIELKVKIAKPPPMTDSEICKGRYIENQMEFGDLLFRGVIGEPYVSFSGLIYSYNDKQEIIYTKINPVFLPPYTAR